MKCLYLLSAMVIFAGCKTTSISKSRCDFSQFLEQAEIKKYTGCNAYPRIPSRDQRDLYLLNYSQMFANYGDNVDFSLRSKALLLTANNRALLYSKASVPPCRYVQGSRPLLEKVVSACRVHEDEQATALNLMRFCRDLYLKRGEGQPLAYGGTEEAMIERGEILCEELARLMVALCEVAGLPGRLVLHCVGGHYTSEIFADGKWCYMDPRMGIYFLKSDGRVASIAELIDSPQIMEQQPVSVQKDVVAYANWDFRAWKCRNIYFTPVELNCFSYYSLADSHLYNYTVLDPKEVDENLKYYNRLYVSFIKKLTPAVPEKYNQK